MTHSAVFVTTDPMVRSELPSHAREGAILGQVLQANGTLDRISRELRLPRNGGYCGIDLFLFLVCYFGSDRRNGLKKFYSASLGWTQAMVAACGRASLSSNSSASRMLAAVDCAVVRLLASDLLRHGCEATSILTHPSVMFMDANHEGWHVFDYDGTRDVMRQRGLPEGDDLPAPVRLSDRVAAPGYPGRKRGEVQILRSALQHAGTGVWLDTRLAPGNGERRPQLASALRAVVDTCADIGHPLSRVLVREDGEFGDVPSLTAHREAGVGCITRLNRLSLLDQLDVRSRMAAGTWVVVPDSGSGPTRSAFDLGVVQVRPGREVARDDGSPYAPIDVRVIIVRRQQSGKADHGRVIEGWQYEVFAALDLDAQAWPAADAISLYYGRAAQENRFAQEDREIGLDRILSYSLGGQELACVVGLLVWNLRTVLGFRLNPPPTERPRPLLRSLEIDPRPVPFPNDALEVEDPVLLAALSEEALPGEEPSADGARTLPIEGNPSDPPIPSTTAEERLRDELNKLQWEQMLLRNKQWSYDPHTGALVCPANHQAALTTVSSTPRQGNPKLMFRVPYRNCDGCPLRETCFASARPNASKMVACTVSKEAAAPLKELLAAAQMERRRLRSEDTLSTEPPSGRPRCPARGEGLPLCGPPLATPPGPWTTEEAHLQPAAARHAWEQAVGKVYVHVHVECPELPKPHPYIATTPQQRQKRRLTWTERIARFAIPTTAEVSVRIEGGHTLGQLFGWPREQPLRRSA